MLAAGELNHERIALRRQNGAAGMEMEAAQRAVPRGKRSAKSQCCWCVIWWFRLVAVADRSWPRSPWSAVPFVLVFSVSTGQLADRIEAVSVAGSAWRRGDSVLKQYAGIISLRRSVVALWRQRASSPAGSSWWGGGSGGFVFVLGGSSRGLPGTVSSGAPTLAKTSAWEQGRTVIYSHRSTTINKEAGETGVPWDGSG